MDVFLFSCKCRNSKQSLTFESLSRSVMMIGLKMTIANFYSENIIASHQTKWHRVLCHEVDKCWIVSYCMPINNHFTAHTRTQEPLHALYTCTLSTSAYLKCIIADLAFIIQSVLRFFFLEINFTACICLTTSPSFELLSHTLNIYHIIYLFIIENICIHIWAEFWRRSHFFYSLLLFVAGVRFFVVVCSLVLQLLFLIRVIIHLNFALLGLSAWQEQKN